MTTAADRANRRSLAILCLAGGLISMDRVSFPLLMQPIAKEFFLSDTQTGMLAGLAVSAMYALAAIPMARWADRGDRRLIVSLSVMVWSLMTAVSGMAQAVWQLFITRCGAGLGEAGIGAPVQSLIADYYPPQRRSLPLSLWGLGASAGGIAGYMLVGAIADRLGWRSALLALGLPGLLLAMLIYIGVIEPRRWLPASGGAAGVRLGFAAALRSMLGKRAVVHIGAGFLIWGIASQGVGQWVAAFLLRTHGISLTQTGMFLGLVSAALCAGVLLGGILGNRLVPRDPRWGLWLPLVALVSYATLLIVGLAAPVLGVALALLCISALAGGMLIGPLMATVSCLVRADARAMSMAILGLLLQVVGASVGPPAVGALSDLLKDQFGAQSLRYALIGFSLLMFWAALHFYLASRHLRDELEESGQ